MNPRRPKGRYGVPAVALPESALSALASYRKVTSFVAVGVVWSTLAKIGRASEQRSQCLDILGHLRVVSSHHRSGQPTDAGGCVDLHPIGVASALAHWNDVP